MLKLYDYIRSSAAYRVRIALAMKGLASTSVNIHLVQNGGEQNSVAYKSINPQGLIPAIETRGDILTQSLAIIEYLEERHPKPALLPEDPIDRAHVRAMAYAVAVDIHPIQNLRVLNYLKGEMGQSEDAVRKWGRHWIEDGLRAFQDLVDRASPDSRYCFGSRVTLADICLAPQMVNARRFDCDLSAVPRLVEIDQALRKLTAFENTTSEIAA